MSCRHVDAPATPTMLRIAPELGALAILDEALATTMCMLVAQHPELGAERDPQAPPNETEARRLYHGLAYASHLLEGYRLAIAQMLAVLDEASIPPDDIPF